MNIIIAGGTGFIGQALTQYFLARGDKITIIGRHLQKIKQVFDDKVEAVTWKSLNSSENFLEQAQLVINLAGANIAEKRWNEQRKNEIIDSRIETTRMLAQACAGLGIQSPALFNASAVGIYGLQKPTATGLPRAYDESYTIDFEHPTDFLSKVARAWEAATWIAKEKGVRVVNLRFGLVLDKKGMLSRLRLPFLLGLGGPIGKGNQPFPWITLDDLIAAVHFIFEKKEIAGPVNIVSPKCISQKEFAKAFASALNRPALLTTPRFLITLVFGEMGRELLLNGQCAYPAVLLSNGFVYKYTEIQPALDHIFEH